MIQVSPQHHAAICQHRFFIVIAQMFKNHIHVRIVAVYLVAYAKPMVNARLIILIPLPHVIGLILGKTFAQIKPKSVDFILFYPVLQIALYKLLHRRLAMVVIVAYIKWMFSTYVEI